ncbi:MAG: tetratricopeptide repeat protein [Bacteroidales bacterium]|jgi:predicted negative regulator of RcsB-dependent stress response|nr:tetratricopeptide repeat protein [Bacteroidales bacterium]
MTNKKGLDKGDERLEVVESTLSKTEQFIENNQKSLVVVVAIIVVVVLGYFGINRYYFDPLEKEAQTQLFMAEAYFEQDSLNKALYGDGNNLGFLDVIDEFGSTKAGNLAKYYAGVSFLKQGEYEEALSHLKKFKGKDKIVTAMAAGAIGDAYLELDKKSEAAAQYLKAARHKSNELTSPMFLLKAGQTYELIGDNKKAVEVYNELKMNFPNTTEGRNAERYIARAQGRS